MSDTLVILDRHRSDAQRLSVTLRRAAIRAGRAAELGVPPLARDRLLHRQLLAPPALRWEQLGERAEFLLGCLSSGQGTGEQEIDTLLLRLLQDAVRLARAGSAAVQDPARD